MATQSFRWWHAVLILVVANVVSFLPAGFNGDEVFYNNFKLPSVAPPDWLFPPMWLFLNITSLVALHRVANSPSSTSRTRFLVSEAVGWVLFAVFCTLYFGLQSPILGAVDTVFGWAVAVVSVWYSFRIDRTAATLIALRLAWLTLASYVSVYVAIYNSDPLFQSLIKS